MKRVETAISRLMPDIDGKRVLEPACGCAEFSIAATAHAAEVVCFDLDDQRLNPEATHTERLRFEIMDATAMRFPDGSFDGASILFIQDIIVLPEFQRKGIGTDLLRAIIRRYPDVYQTELMTDNTDKTIAFYKSLGFTPATEFGCLGFMKLNT